MANVVIVAIPEEDDYVWKISSEKVPHMTILSLGEQEPSPKLAQVESYLGHAVETMLHKFGMSVDHRDVLGPKEADVLIFDKSFCEQRLKEFRDALLKNNVVLDLYNDVVQYPDWVPHLTLGYPESPANADERDYPGVHWVNFDKIALWVDDFDGPEWRLNGYDNALSMSDLRKALDLSQTVDPNRDAVQYGKLGMRWGVRRARGSDGRVVGTVSSSDAAQAAEIRKKIGRKGNLSKLSNEEIQKLVTRINLENSLARAASESSKVTKANTLAKKGLDLGKTANEAIKFYNSDAGQVIRALVGQDSHSGGRHNKLNQPIGQLVNTFGAKPKGKSGGGGKRKKNP